MRYSLRHHTTLTLTRPVFEPMEPRRLYPPEFTSSFCFSKRHFSPQITTPHPRQFLSAVSCVKQNSLMEFLWKEHRVFTYIQCTVHLKWDDTNISHIVGEFPPWSSWQTYSYWAHNKTMGPYSMQIDLLWHKYCIGRSLRWVRLN